MDVGQWLSLINFSNTIISSEGYVQSYSIILSNSLRVIEIINRFWNHFVILCFTKTVRIIFIIIKVWTKKNNGNESPLVLIDPS